MITTGLVGRLNFLRGVHTPGDVYRIALYKPTATLHPRSTLVYSPVEEVFGAGYEGGGQLLKGLRYDENPEYAWMSWTKAPKWDDATITARGALIYNQSKQGLVLAVLDFGETVVSTNGPFEVPLPHDLIFLQ